MGKVTERAKRKGGRLSGKAWLVLEESQKIPGEGWMHECGWWVDETPVTFSHRDGVAPFSGSGGTKTITVPFCRYCELKPVSGEHSDEGALHVTTWES